MSNNKLYHSYFDTVSTERKSTSHRTSPTKNSQEPPKKLSKAFTRQLAKTLATSKKPLHRKRNKKEKHLKRNRPVPATMPKRAAAETYDSDGGFVENEEEDARRSKKKSRANTSKDLPTKGKDKDGGVYWEISGKRRLQLSEFKGNTMVGVREYYEKDGQALPGKKGISMTLDQFNTIVELLPQLESELKKSGGVLSRPKYDRVIGGSAAGDDGEEEEEEEELVQKKENMASADEVDEEEEEKPVQKKSKSKLDKFKHKSKNHEATSDEDEG